MADTSLALLLGQHELVRIVMMMHGLVVEQAVPGDVMGICSTRGCIGLLFRDASMSPSVHQQQAYWDTLPHLLFM